jgi:hypothetical protein
MAVRNRNVVVLFILIVSMTVGALVLMALDNHPPIKGDGIYNLTSYHRLDSAHKRALYLIEIDSAIQNLRHTNEELEIK